MRVSAVLLAAFLLFGSPSTRPAFPAPDEKAVQRAMEQQRKAAEAEMRRQAEYEKKVMLQQQRAMQEQMKAQQKYVEMQQKAMHEQQKAIQNQQKATQNQPVAKPPHITTTATATPAYHATRPYYGHQSYGHAYHRTSYRNYRTMPNQVDPQTRALQRLKASLDNVRMGSPVTSAEKSAIKKGLMGVVVVPKVPTIASIETLAGHLADGLANRASQNAQTGPMALTLRGALNSSELANNEVTEIMNEHRAALKTSKVRPSEITPIMESLKTVSNQVRSRR
jgi:hypothetical protein